MLLMCKLRPVLTFRLIITPQSLFSHMQVIERLCRASAIKQTDKMYEPYALIHVKITILCEIFSFEASVPYGT